MRSRSCVIRLCEYEEVIGLLHTISNEDGMTVANIGNTNVMLPEETIQELQSHLGKRVSVLRTDLPGKEYLVRVYDRSMDLEDSAAQETACA